MSVRTEQLIDKFIVHVTDFTKLSETTMRWDGASSITGQGLNPTLLINGGAVDTTSQVINNGDVLTVAE